MSDNAYINDLEERLAEAEKQLTAANATIAACKAAGFIDAEGRVRKRWYATHVCDARCQGEDGHHTWPPHDPSAAAKEAQ